MADRLVVGKANDGTSDVYGLWVSKPGVNVINSGTGVLAASEDLLFDSRNVYGQVLKSGTETCAGDSTTVVTFTAQNGQTPPVFIWKATDTELTNVVVGTETNISVSFSITGNSGTMNLINSKSNSITVGYILWALES